LSSPAVGHFSLYLVGPCRQGLNACQAISEPDFYAHQFAIREQWTVPVGGGIGRVIHWGKQAINLRAAAYGNVIKPDQGSDYNIQFSATFLFPEKK